MSANGTSPVSESLGALSLVKGEEIRWQLFSTPNNLAANVIYLHVYIALQFLVVMRLKEALVIGYLVVYNILQITVFSLRIYEVQHDHYSLEHFRAMQGIAAISVPILLECLRTLVAEHFATATANQYSHHGIRTHRHLNKFLSLILLGVFIAAVYFAANLGSKNVAAADRAYIIMQFIFLGLLLLHLAFRAPYLRYGTTAWLFVLAAIALMCPIYAELRFDGTTVWASSEAAFYVLWCMPQTVIVLGIIAIPVYRWYPNHHTWWIY